MPKPFDATLKDLVETYPRDWLAQLGLDASLPVEVIDADLSTVTAQADRVLRVHDTDPWLLHLELQSGRDPFLAGRVLKYNVLLLDRHSLPVHSAVVLLRREADDPSLTGVLQMQPPHGRSSLVFRYEVVRLWERPVGAILAGGLGTLPLAPLCDVSPRALPAVIRRMEERLSREIPPAQAATLWTSTYILMGLRYPPALAVQLLEGVRAMKESTTYKAILDEGRAEEARKVLLLLGNEKLGPPDASTREALEAITDLDRLERMLRRLLKVSGWGELLGSS
jgi:predicted transposase YdaD